MRQRWISINRLIITIAGVLGEGTFSGHCLLCLSLTIIVSEFVYVVYVFTLCYLSHKLVRYIIF